MRSRRDRRLGSPGGPLPWIGSRGADAARRPIHVADRSTCLHGLQFNDPSCLQSPCEHRPRRLTTAARPDPGPRLVGSSASAGAGDLLPCAPGHPAVVLAPLSSPTSSCPRECHEPFRRSRRGTPSPSHPSRPRRLHRCVVVAISCSLRSWPAKPIGWPERCQHGRGEPRSPALAATFQSWRDTITGAGVFPRTSNGSSTRRCATWWPDWARPLATWCRASFALFPKILELIAVPLLTSTCSLMGHGSVRRPRIPAFFAPG